MCGMMGRRCLASTWAATGGRDYKELPPALLHRVLVSVSSSWQESHARHRAVDGRRCEVVGLGLGA